MRHRAVVPLLVLPLALVTACSSSGDSSMASSTGSSTDQPRTVEQPTGGPTTPAAAGAGAATQSPGGTATSRPAASATTSQAPGAQPLATKAPGSPAASEATPAGTYTYDVSGTVAYGTTRRDASGSAVLTITAVKDGVQTSRLEADGGDTDQTVLVRDAGSYLASLHLTTSAFDKEFRPSPAALLLPDPAKVGTRWSWSATSTDGASTVRTSHEVIRTETITVGGKAVQTVVVQSRVVISGDVSYTSDVTTWVVPSLRLPVKDHTVGKGTFGGLQVTSDTTSLMRSTSPA